VVDVYDEDETTPTEEFFEEVVINDWKLPTTRLLRGKNVNSGVREDEEIFLDKISEARALVRSAESRFYGRDRTPDEPSGELDPDNCGYVIDWRTSTKVALSTAEANAKAEYLESWELRMISLRQAAGLRPKRERLDFKFRNSKDPIGPMVTYKPRHTMRYEEWLAMRAAEHNDPLPAPKSAIQASSRGTA